MSPEEVRVNVEDGSLQLPDPDPDARAEIPTPLEVPNEYSVHVHEGERGWEVRIADPDGVTVWARSCSGEVEARTLASTVQQHIYWLSPEKFRAYYRLEEPA